MVRPTTARLPALRPRTATPWNSNRARCLSTTAVPPSATTTASSNASTTTPPTTPTATLLADLSDLLKRYPLLRETSWSQRLEGAAADLTHPRRARVAVIGDKQSGAAGLVTAAFDDPLASEGDLSVALASRRLGDSPEAIAITYGLTARNTPHEVALPAAWLRDNKADVVEIIHGDVPPLQSSVDALYSSDAVVLVITDTRGLSSIALRNLIHTFRSKPNLVLAFNSRAAPSPSSSTGLDAQLSSLLGSEDRPTIIAVSVEEALAALEALAPTEPNAPVSFERFQTGYVASGVPQLKERLAQAVSTLGVPASEPGVTSSLQRSTARYTLDSAVDAAAVEGAKVDDALFQASTDIAALSFVASESAASVLTSLGVSDGLLKIPEADVHDASHAFRDLLDGRLEWYQLPWRTDDLVAELALVSSSSYLLDFESSLVFSTGRLISLSSNLASQTDSLLSTPSFSPTSAQPLASLYSPTLLNTIAQASRESNRIPSTALSSSVVARRSQITAPGGPAEVLQSRAQKAVASAASLGGGSVALGLGMQALEYAELATNVGVGLFGSVLAAWIMQRSWGKAKKKFYVDVDERVTGGLEEDLGVAAQRLVERSLYKATTAVALSEELLRTRRWDFERFKARLGQIDSQARAGK